MCLALAGGLKWGRGCVADCGLFRGRLHHIPHWMEYISLCPLSLREPGDKSSAILPLAFTTPLSKLLKIPVKFRPSEAMSEDKATPDQHVKQVFDSEHVSGRAGTLLVATHFDKSTLGLHDIDKVDTNAVASLKTTPDGQTVLIPQPTNDPEQPLNWSWGRKHKVLLLLVYCTLVSTLSQFTSLLPTYPLDAARVRG